jgi:hypothetical protein
MRPRIGRVRVAAPLINFLNCIGGVLLVAHGDEHALSDLSHWSPFEKLRVDNAFPYWTLSRDHVQAWVD